MSHNDLLAIALDNLRNGNDGDHHGLACQHIRSACLACDRLSLYNEINIEWSNRLTSCMGKAYPGKRVVKHGVLTKEYKIVLSTQLWERATPEQRKETAIHEACHIIDFCNRNKSAHDWEWRSLMSTCGYPNASRCHDVDNSGLTRRRGRMERFPATCGCGSHPVTKTLRKRMRMGTRYKCRKCNTTITLGKPVKEGVNV